MNNQIIIYLKYYKILGETRTLKQIIETFKSFLGFLTGISQPVMIITHIKLFEKFVFYCTAYLNMKKGEVHFNRPFSTAFGMEI